MWGRDQSSYGHLLESHVSKVQDKKFAPKVLSHCQSSVSVSYEIQGSIKNNVMFEEDTVLNNRNFVYLFPCVKKLKGTLLQ